MARGIKLTLDPIGKVYDIYTGLTSGSTTGLTCNGIIDECQFEFSDGISEEYVWIKCVTTECGDQIFQVYIGSS